MSLPTSLSPDAILYGQDPTPGIVAVEPDQQEGLWLFRRGPEGVTRERVPCRPWILLPGPPPFPLADAVYSPLDGEGYRLLAEFPNQAAFRSARQNLRDAHADHLSYGALAKLALIRSGQTLFKGMTFDDVARLQFDIETEGLSPESGRILMIVLSHNGGEPQVIEGDEREMLERFAQVIRERDPDVLEGHNVFTFDLPFLIGRARRLGMRLPLGRDGSDPWLGQERSYAIGGMSRPFIPVNIYGRHVLDTYLVVQRFDWAKGAVSSYGLKECARVFGLSAADRVELPGADIAAIYRRDPELVRTYACQDVIETARLASLVSPVEFYQTQMTPDNYQQVVVSGNGEKINSIFLRAYLAAGRAVPFTQPSQPYAGAFTEVRVCGVVDTVVKADVESLYPSLMLSHQIAPASDRLGIFLPALRALTERRIEAKRRAAELSGRVSASSSASEAHFWDGLQGSFKVLINSFYGYVGGPFNWNDYAAASRVTELGRELIQGVAARLEQTGSRIIEIDTDGVYFVPPAAVAGDDAERAYVQQIGIGLPDGVRLAFDGRFRAMLSVKTKNYVLVGYDGRRIFRGSSLRSRADEPYGRRFLAEAVDLLLARDREGIGALYARYIDDLLQKRFSIDDLARRERVTEKTFQSEQKARNAKVAAGVAIGEHVRVYERADGSLGLHEEYAGDENTRYYMEKLYKFARRLEDAFEGEFDRIIPKPTADGLPRRLQMAMEL